MRIIFITPLLWKRLDRAVRRREEGQALILVAFAAIAMVAVVGLSVDGGMAYLEAQRLQRAAENAALAGVVWVPSQKIIADGRGKLGSLANGYNVYISASGVPGGNPLNPASPDYINKNWTYNDLVADKANPGRIVSYIGEMPKETDYKVTLGEFAPRYFLGVVGLGNYYIQRSATAQYSRQVKLGSSFNYFGSSGVLYDPNVNSASTFDIYQRYAENRCGTPNLPVDENGNPKCVGTFWANISGADNKHANGDAYTPIYDGQDNRSFAVSNYNSPAISSSNNLTQQCVHTTDSNSWLADDTSGNYSGIVPNGGAANAANCDTQKSLPQPLINKDIHPDSVTRRNFGYEVGIEITSSALRVSPATNISHTNVNISIYDAAIASVGSLTQFGTGDTYNLFPTLGSRDDTGRPNPVPVTDYPYATLQGFPFYPQRYTSVPGKNYGPPYTGTVEYGVNSSVPAGADRGECPTPNIANPYNSQPEANNLSFRRCLSQYWITGTVNSAITNTFVSTGQFPQGDPSGLKFGQGQPYRFNEMRTRYSLYWPPAADGTSSIYANVAFAGNKVGSFEVGDMSIRIAPVGNGQPQTLPVGPNAVRKPQQSVRTNMPIEWESRTPTRPASIQPPGADPNPNKDTNAAAGQNSSYCYIVSLNPPARNVAQDNNRGFPVLNVPSVAPTTTNLALTGQQAWNDTQFVYACPQSTINGEDFAKDYYWGLAFPSTQSPYGRPTQDENNTLPATYARETGPYATVSKAMSNTAIVTWQTTPISVDYPYGVKPANKDFIDPGQECRISISSIPDGRGVKGEYEVEPAAIGNTSTVEPLYQYYNPRMPFNAAYGDRINEVAPSPNGYYTKKYFSRHGWRCAWDFDSDYDPRFNPLKPGSAGNNVEALDPPGALGPNQAGVQTNHGLGTNGTYRGTWYGNGKVEPYFHLTDWTFNAAGSVVLKPGVIPGSKNAVVRAGTYMLHVQTYGGAGANRYSVKAEYENATEVTYDLGYDPVTFAPRSLTQTPVPNVFGITTMSLYTNAVNRTDRVANIVFDLAYIPPENAGSTAILQLFDPGDVAADLYLSLREPSKSGNRLMNDPSGSGKRIIDIGQAITVAVSAYPYYLSNTGGFKQGPSISRVPMRVNGEQFYNDQWVYMTFQIPSRDRFKEYLKNCQANGVPETACYYFQVDYELSPGAGGTAGFGDDTTTWQIVVQGAPVRLLR